MITNYFTGNCFFIIFCKRDNSVHSIFRCNNYLTKKQVMKLIVKLYNRFKESSHTRIGYSKIEKWTIYYLHHKYWFFAIISVISNIEEQMKKIYGLVPLIEPVLDQAEFDWEKIRALFPLNPEPCSECKSICNPNQNTFIKLNQDVLEL